MQLDRYAINPFIQFSQVLVTSSLTFKRQVQKSGKDYIITKAKSQAFETTISFRLPTALFPVFAEDAAEKCSLLLVAVKDAKEYRAVTSRIDGVTTAMSGVVKDMLHHLGVDPLQ